LPFALPSRDQVDARINFHVKKNRKVIKRKRKRKGGLGRVHT